MKQKLFTLLTLLLCAVSTTWADEAVLYYGVDKGANSITVNGFTIAITGNTSKTWSGGADITYNENTYKSLKNSNGAQNTVTCPTGKVATSVDFYAIPNTNNDEPKLTEFDGVTCNDVVTTTKDGTNPTKITKSLNNKSSFTFTFGNKQANIILVVTYKDAPADVVANPTFTQTGNSVEMACATVGAKIYYTTDGTEPSTSSYLYSSAIKLTTPCTIRAKAFNGESNEYNSDEVTRDCYFSNDGSLAVLGYNGGSVDGDVWTSTNGDFILTNNVEGRGIGYTNLAGSQDGFKLNHTDSYTLKVSEDIKVTKLVVVGKSWLKSENGNNASTIAFDDFTPASATFYDYPTDGETYVKTAEFTPSSELDYGASIIMRPGTNQLGAYIEVYGVKRNGPAAPEAVGGESVTWDFSSSAAQTAAGTIAEGESNTLKATDGKTTLTYVAGSGDKWDNNYLKSNGTSSSTRYFVIQISTNGKLSLTSTTNNGIYTIKKAADTNTTFAEATELTTITTENDGVAVEGNITYDADKPYLVIGFTNSDGKKYTQKITWTPSSEDITLTTSDNMAGWRAFYPEGKGYTLDENTTAYVITANPVNNKVSLEKTSNNGKDVYPNTPVILYTSSAADSHKMTLTKATVDDYNGTNLLEWATSAVNNVYRLGYGDNGVGFYPYSGTPTSGAVILNVSSANAGSAKALTFSFSDVTGISNAAAAEAANAGTGKMYNLSGQIVGEGYKGIVIVNGKKVIK